MSAKSSYVFRLVASVDSGGFIVIADNFKREGQSLLREFIKSSPEKASTHLLFLETNHEQFSCLNKDMTLHSIFSNDSDVNPINYVASLPNGRVLIVDSLLPFAICYPESFTRIIGLLKSKFRKVVALVNPEVLSFDGYSTIKNLADTVIEMPQKEKETEYNVYQKKIKGGICIDLVKLKEPYTISEKGDFVFAKRSQSTSHKELFSSDFKESLPFSLQIELEDGSSVKEKNIRTKTKKEAIIHYLPGKEDDVDEEDPDEDLLF